MIKKSFITGLVILLPVALTSIILIFIFNLLTVPFLGIVKAVFAKYHWFQEGFLFLSPSQFQTLIAQLMILVFLFITTITLGLITRWFFFRSLIKLAEYIVKKIPLVSVIYRTCKEVIKTIFTSKSNSFKQVVLVPFPNPHTYSLGLITRESIPSLEGSDYEQAVTVFVPTTPNPTSGFLVIYKPENIIYLDMKVEDAFKYIISCGLIAAPFNKVNREEIVQQLEKILVEESV